MLSRDISKAQSNFAKLKIKSDVFSLYRLYSLLLEDSLDFKNKVSMKLRAINLPIPL